MPDSRPSATDPPIREDREEHCLRLIERVLRSDDLRRSFRAWIEPPPSSLFRALSSNTLFQILLGFLLTGVLGAVLTNHYAERQKEIERVRSFADKVNEARLARIVEVWEKLSLHEAAASRFVDDSAEIDRIMSLPESARPQKADPAARLLAERTTADMKDFVTLAKEIRDLSARHRIWLGEKMYERVLAYLSETNDITSSGLVDATRAAAISRSRATLGQIRDLVFKE